MAGEPNPDTKPYKPQKPGGPPWPGYPKPMPPGKDWPVKLAKKKVSPRDKKAPGPHLA